MTIAGELAMALSGSHEAAPILCGHQVYLFTEARKWRHCLPKLSKLIKRRASGELDRMVSRTRISFWDLARRIPLISFRFGLSGSRNAAPLQASSQASASVGSQQGT